MTEQSTYNRPSRYAMIPEWVIYHPDLTGSDVRVYAVMARMADAEGRCYPKADTVASRLNVSDDTVRRSIARLEAAGALRVEPKMGAGGYRSNDFLIAGDTPLTNKITPERAKQKADAEANGRKSAAAGGCRKSAATAAATVRRQVPQICGDKEGEPSLNENQLNENQISPSTVPVEDPFDRFWQHYPRKVSKVAARRKWATITKGGVDPEAVIAGAAAFAAFTKADQTEPRFIKHPDVWLNKGCWEDELEPSSERTARRSRTLADKSAQYERVLNRLGAAS